MKGQENKIKEKGRTNEIKGKEMEGNEKKRT